MQCYVYIPTCMDILCTCNRSGMSRGYLIAPMFLSAACTVSLLIFCIIDVVGDFCPTCLREAHTSMLVNHSLARWPLVLHDCAIRARETRLTIVLPASLYYCPNEAGSITYRVRCLRLWPSTQYLAIQSSLDAEKVQKTVYALYV